ncbi:MAG: 50S ribosomal protein L25 [Bacteriovoracaceae bacterium]|nr:50S ribosomal protein L25 [Bacteriovoracaceae bacterium]
MDKMLNAEKRDLNVKAGRVRKAGFVPACVYGHEVKSTPIQISKWDMKKCLASGALKVELKVGTTTHLVAIEEVQKTYSNEIIHVAFHALKQNEKTHMHVPIHLVGDAKGKEAGAVVMQQINELTVYGYPKDIPDEIVVNVAHLDVDDSVHVKDLVSKFKFEFHVDDLEKTLCVCHFPRIQEIPEAPVAEVAPVEGAEVVELAAAAGTTPAAPGTEKTPGVKEVAKKSDAKPEKKAA